ncbi:metallophosphoesterase family protein [Pedobacter sp. P351]|uniref:metallophosphoesterase family protein n=1 Tax=Pedobacter superstes TaxID=3133441 RepID=UPI0030AA2FEE
MRIALFSDVHANLPAFEAFLDDLDHKKPDSIYCLGDLVGYNIWPNEIIAEIRRRGIATIAGNHDLKVKRLSSEASGKNYAYSIIGEEERSYLKALPSHIRLEYKLNTESLNMLLVHGSPRSIDEYMLEDMNEDYALDLLTQTRADIIFCGHSHLPYQRIFQIEDSGTYSVKRIINTGSVGKPKDGDPRGCYVLLTLKEGNGNKEDILVEFVRFSYDVEKAAKAVEESPLPDEFADRLRRAY